MIEIVEPGPLSSIQDLGRPGFAALGVPRSGAFDRAALRLANRLVGNPETAAALELTLGGAVLHIRAAATIALTGALCPGAPEWHGAVTVWPGTTLRLGRPEQGLRTYLAVRGGIDVPPVLGSRSTDRLSGLGPDPLGAGAVLAVGPEPPAAVSPAAAPPPVLSREVAVLLGPRDDWFTAGARDLLLTAAWTVSSASDRIGIRLDGPVLERAVLRELPSEPTRPGALQVPPDGRPILFGPDAPVTGGYPVIAVVSSAGLDAAAQWRPGDAVRFRKWAPVRSAPGAGA